MYIAYEQQGEGVVARIVTGIKPCPNASHARNDTQPDKGMVLLIVLWWLVLLAFLATQLAATTRTAAMIASNLRDSASAEAAADGAVNEAIFQFLAHRWQA